MPITDTAVQTIDPVDAVIILTTNQPVGKFITKASKWMAIDNTNGRVLFEAFVTEKQAISWLQK